MDVRAALREGERSGHEKGLQQGLQKGLQKGLRQGVLRGQADLLRDLLQHRFGDLPEVLHQRLDQGTANDLLQWSRAVLTAESIEDVFSA